VKKGKILKFSLDTDLPCEMMVLSISRGEHRFLFTTKDSNNHGHKTVDTYGTILTDYADEKKKSSIINRK